MNSNMFLWTESSLNFQKGTVKLARFTTSKIQPNEQCRQFSDWMVYHSKWKCSIETLMERLNPVDVQEDNFEYGFVLRRIVFFCNSGHSGFQQQAKQVSFHLHYLSIFQNIWFRIQWRSKHSSCRFKRLNTENFRKSSHVFVIAPNQNFDSWIKIDEFEANTFLKLGNF